ncbi:hypothetical protein H0H93_014726 [Arthromyces matolae]|nr:hypothetical protein H0H93_014726 [Arthromyces matolae]
MSDQTAAAGPSTIPIITISTEKLPPSESEDSSSVSSAMSPTLTALETPTTLEHPLSQLETLEQELAAFAQKKQAGNPTVSQEPTIQDAVERIDATPPRTQSGVPNPLKRSNKTPAKAQQDEKSIQDTSNGEIQPWHGVVVDYSPPQKEQAKMVYSSPNIPYNNEAWAFQRATGYSDYIGSGFVFINVNGEKRRKNVKDNTYGTTTPSATSPKKKQSSSSPKPENQKPKTQSTREVRNALQTSPSYSSNGSSNG